MDDKTKHALEVESAKGQQYASAWESMVAPFFDAKQEELYNTFCEIPVGNQEALLAIHTQTKALASLKDHFRHYIETGQMARTQLTEAEKSKKENTDEG